MKPIYFIIDYDSIVGTVYEHSKFGKVIVLDRKSIDLSCPLEIHSAKYGEWNKETQVDVLDIILEHLGIENNENLDSDE